MGPRLQNRSAISVAVFAHNEEKDISISLGAICNGGLGPHDRIFVLINGSSDQTELIAQGIADKDPRIEIEVIELADKANAWNYYLNHLAPDDVDFHFFIDGDVRVSAGSFCDILELMDRHPEALAASTLPKGGRISKSWSKRILREHGMPGNFYALRHETAQRIRQKGIAMPVGLVGDDPLLRWLLLRDLDPGNTIVKDRIRPVPTAIFEYDSIPITSFSGIQLSIQRQLRYSLRDLEMNTLIPALVERGLAAMPRTIDRIHRQAKPLSALKGPFAFRKIAFLYTWLRTRSPKPRLGVAWYEG